MIISVEESMSDTLDAFLDDLQSQVFEETRETLGEEACKRWRNPVHFGKMEDPSTQAGLTGSCGDSLTVYLKIENARVKTASFTTDGCASSQICGDVACEFAEGKSIEDAGLVDGKDVLQVLGGLPEDNKHCAYLAAETLREAVRKYLGKREG